MAVVFTVVVLFRTTTAVEVARNSFSSNEVKASCSSIQQCCSNFVSTACVCALPVSIWQWPYAQSSMEMKRNAFPSVVWKSLSWPAQSPDLNPVQHRELEHRLQPRPCSNKSWWDGSRWRQGERMCWLASQSAVLNYILIILMMSVNWPEDGHVCLLSTSFLLMQQQHHSRSLIASADAQS